ncbi:probable tubulin polyglutamylase TTLL2 [Panthera tigris]|uniref:probable tubulin polyglutamylase TTLL2 n=1 Tax=Panthera tigris TaxID=9694 RepID=UPI001C6F8FBA|nr:probable tubulin polyglutamylase TTLL2 [Panthera tigris]XP_042843467.1 probable tubulin polyglutamylase TTLL2 [Panthera tigris]XP_042843468.1 probable tubulin polyglutamylase TTLL2 [Panthera tigris]XP_042843469.1 probable tubulin polyglutamylase TTLL2 [Panthera tigris]
MAGGRPSGAIPKPPGFPVDDPMPEAVQSVLPERGWDKFDEGGQNSEDWNLYCGTSSCRMTERVSVKPGARAEPPPGHHQADRKDRLARHLKRMEEDVRRPPARVHPADVRHAHDYNKFMAEYSREKHVTGAKHSSRICKPVEPSRGTGIIISSDIKDLDFDDTYIVRKYTCHPFLVGRGKPDLRICVCITGFKPLTIYMYPEGLARFATEKFDLSNLQNSYAPLTNLSINKSGASYEKIKEVIGRGNK